MKQGNAQLPIKTLSQVHSSTMYSKLSESRSNKLLNRLEKKKKWNKAVLVFHIKYAHFHTNIINSSFVKVSDIFAFFFWDLDVRMFLYPPITKSNKEFTFCLCSFSLLLCWSFRRNGFQGLFLLLFFLQPKSEASSAFNLAPLPATRKLIEKQTKCPGEIVEQVASEL